VAILRLQFHKLFLHLIELPGYRIIEQSGQLRLAIQTCQRRPDVADVDRLGVEIPSLGKMAPE